MADAFVWRNRYSRGYSPAWNISLPNRPCGCCAPIAPGIARAFAYLILRELDCAPSVPCCAGRHLGLAEARFRLAVATHSRRGGLMLRAEPLYRIQLMMLAPSAGCCAGARPASVCSILASWQRSGARGIACRRLSGSLAGSRCRMSNASSCAATPDRIPSTGGRRRHLHGRLQELNNWLKQVWVPCLACTKAKQRPRTREPIYERWRNARQTGTANVDLAHLLRPGNLLSVNHWQSARWRV